MFVNDEAKNSYNIDVGFGSGVNFCKGHPGEIRQRGDSGTRTRD